jgi:hypothetical protein
MLPSTLAVELQEVERVQHRLADRAVPVEGVEDRALSCTQSGPAGGLAARVGCPAGGIRWGPFSEGACDKSTDLLTVAATAAAVVRESDEMKGFRTSALTLGLWWRIAVALWAALAVTRPSRTIGHWHPSRLPYVPR